MFVNRYSITKILASLALFVAWGASTSARAQVDLSLPDLEGVNGQAMSMSIQVDNLTGLNVSGFQLEVQYDPNVIQFTDINTSGSLSSGLTTLSNSPAPGRFRVVAAGASALSGSGTLITMTGFYVDPGTTNVTWAEFEFDNAAVTVNLDPGTVTVTDQIAAIGVRVGHVSGRPGETASIPIMVDDLSGLEVPGFSFSVSYNPSVVDIQGIRTTGTLSAGRNVQANRPFSGRIDVEDQGTDYLSGEGVLLYLTGEFQDVGTSVLDLVTFSFDRVGIDAVPADGEATTANVAPAFTSSPVLIARAGIRYEYLAVAVDGDGDPLTLAAADTPTWASFQDNGNGTGLLYGTPGTGAIGVHNVTLTATDPFGVMGIQTFSISVVPNSAPVAVDDNATTHRGQSVEIDVLANDSDPDGDPLMVQSVGAASNGSAVLTAGGTVLYTPNPLFSGVDTFNYMMSDGLEHDQALVTVTVANMEPVAMDDAATVFAGSSVTIDLLANDTDADGDNLSVSLVDEPAGGSVVNNGDGTILYTAFAQFEGEDIFGYTVTDGFGGSSSASVTVVVVGPSTDGDGVADDVEAGAPNGGDGNDDGIPDSEQENVASLPIVGGENAGLYLTLAVEEGLTLGQVMSRENPDPAGAPNVNFPLGFLTYNIEGLDPGATTTITIHYPGDVVVNGYMKYGSTPETPFDHWYDFYYDGATGYQQGSAMAMLTFTDGMRGDDDLVANGRIMDPGALIQRDNQPPVAVNDTVSVLEDESVTIAVLDNDFDVDGDPIFLVMVGQALHGTILNNGDGTVTYTPEPDYFGADGFTYTITDGTTAHVTGSVTVDVISVEDSPVAMDDFATTLEDTPVEINIFANDFDPDMAFSLASIGQPAHGRVVYLGNAMVRYTPDADYHGTDSFNYTVTDGTDWASATVTVHVVAANDAPLFANNGVLLAPADEGHFSLTGDPEQTYHIEWPVATDPDGDAVQYRLQIAYRSSFENQYMLFEINMHEGTSYEQEVGYLANLLVGIGIQLNESVDIYFRAVASDGVVDVMSEITTCTVLLGTITANEDGQELPSEVILDQNYPNPFNPATTIRFALPAAGHVQIAVFNMLGSQVGILVDAQLPAGLHETTFSAGTLPSGIYIYRMKAGDKVLSRTFTLLK